MPLGLGGHGAGPGGGQQEQQEEDGTWAQRSSLRRRVAKVRYGAFDVIGPSNDRLQPAFLPLNRALGSPELASALRVGTDGRVDTGRWRSLASAAHVRTHPARSRHRLDRSHRRQHVQRQDRGADPPPAPRADRPPAGRDLQARRSTTATRATRIVSHSELRIPSRSVEDRARTILRYAHEAQVIGIDEGQFLGPDLVEVCERLARKGKRVIVAGLDQDYAGRPFEPMPQLLAIAEYITKTLAICMVCGAPANRTYRKKTPRRPRGGGRRRPLRGALPALLRAGPPRPARPATAPSTRRNPCRQPMTSSAPPSPRSPLALAAGLRAEAAEPSGPTPGDAAPRARGRPGVRRRRPRRQVVQRRRLRRARARASRSWASSSTRSRPARAPTARRRCASSPPADAQLVFGVGFLFTDDIRTLAQEFPDKKFACVDYTVNARRHAAAEPGRAQVPGGGRLLPGRRARGAAHQDRQGRLRRRHGDPADQEVRGRLPRRRAGGATRARRCSSSTRAPPARAFKDPTKGKELALAEYHQGADIIFHASGSTGLGVFEAARELEQARDRRRLRPVRRGAGRHPHLDGEARRHRGVRHHPARCRTAAGQGGVAGVRAGRGAAWPGCTTTATRR